MYDIYIVYHNVGLDAWIYVQAQLGPVRRIETTCGLVFVLGVAADVEKGLHSELWMPTGCQLLLPVSAVMVLMQGLEPHPTVRSDNHRTIRL